VKAAAVLQQRKLYFCPPFGGDSTTESTIKGSFRRAIGGRRAAKPSSPADTTTVGLKNVVANLTLRLHENDRYYKGSMEFNYIF
jgi:hypothetical protein